LLTSTSDRCPSPAALIIEDLVSRKRIGEIVSAEEASTQVELAFTAAIEAEGLLEAVERRSSVE
jgi:hypothetical protein